VDITETLCLVDARTLAGCGYYFSVTDSSGNILCECEFVNNNGAFVNLLNVPIIDLPRLASLRLMRMLQALNGSNVYYGCCTLRIDFSKLSTLNVRYNNEKSRDFTDPTLSAGNVAVSPFSVSVVGYGTGQLSRSLHLPSLPTELSI